MIWVYDIDNEDGTHAFTNEGVEESSACSWSTAASHVMGLNAAIDWGHHTRGLHLMDTICVRTNGILPHSLKPS